LNQWNGWAQTPVFGGLAGIVLGADLSATLQVAAGAIVRFKVLAFAGISYYFFVAAIKYQYNQKHLAN
jgi:hypothetical protein